MAPETLPEYSEGESGGDLIRVDRGERPKLTAFEQKTMANCERSLGKEEWRETTSERQRGTLELMGLSKWKDEQTTEGGERRISTAQESPKPPPPKAPTYSRDTVSQSQRGKGGKGRKRKCTK